MMRPNEINQPGIGVDAQGGAVVDPTKNVLDLVGREITRLDDMAHLRALLVDEKIKRVEQAGVHLQENAMLRAEFDKEIRRMESDRLDKIRQVDVSNAAATAAQLLSAVTTLATTQQAAAETLRNQVQTTAVAAGATQERFFSPILERLALLEKFSNVSQGRQAFSDPQLTELLIEMKNLRGTKSEGVSAVGVVVAGAVALLVGLIAIGSFLFALLK